MSSIGRGAARKPSSSSAGDGDEWSLPSAAADEYKRDQQRLFVALLEERGREELQKLQRNDEKDSDLIERGVSDLQLQQRQQQQQQIQQQQRAVTFVETSAARARRDIEEFTFDEMDARTTVYNNDATNKPVKMLAESRSKVMYRRREEQEKYNQLVAKVCKRVDETFPDYKWRDFVLVTGLSSDCVKSPVQATFYHYKKTTASPTTTAIGGGGDKYGKCLTRYETDMKSEEHRYNVVQHWNIPPNVVHKYQANGMHLFVKSFELCMGRMCSDKSRYAKDVLLVQFHLGGHTEGSTCSSSPHYHVLYGSKTPVHNTYWYKTQAKCYPWMRTSFMVNNIASVILHHTATDDAKGMYYLGCNNYRMVEIARTVDDYAKMNADWICRDVENHKLSDEWKCSIDWDDDDDDNCSDTEKNAHQQQDEEAHSTDDEAYGVKKIVKKMLAQ